MRKIFSLLYFFAFSSGIVFSLNACQTTKNTTTPVKIKENPQKKRPDVLQDYTLRASSTGFNDAEIYEAFMVAESLSFAGKEKDALVLYEPIFKESPTLVVGLKMARIYASTKDLVKAEEVSKKLVAFYPKNPAPILALAYIEELKGQKKESLMLLKSGFESHPDSEELAIRYIDSLIQDNQLEPAKKALFLAQAKIPSSVPLLMRLSKILLASKETKEAKETLSKLLLLDPQNAEGWTLAGYIASEENDDAAAENAFREASDLAPENDDITSYYISQLIKSGKFQDAFHNLQRLESYKDSQKGLDPQHQYQMAYVLFQLEDYDGSKSRFEKLLETFKDKGRIYFFLGQCEEMLKQVEKALVQYSKVDESSELYQFSQQRKIFLNIDKGDLSAAKQLLSSYMIQPNEKDSGFRFVASVYARLKNYQEAKKTVDQGLIKFPKSSDLLYLKAAYTEFTVSKERSLFELEKFLGQFPDNTQALNHLGYSLAESKVRLDFAIALLKRAIKLEPKNGFFLDSLGWALFQNGKVAEGEKFLLQALSLEPEEPVILEHLGELNFQRKDLASARKYFELAERLFLKKEQWRIAMDPEWTNSNKRVKSRLEEIRKMALPST